MSKFYIGMCVCKNINVEVLGRPRSIEASWMVGQIGALPVFETKEDALNAGYKEEEIQEVSTV